MKGLYENEMKLEFISKSNNEAFARITVAAFAAQLDPTIEELADIKTAVSEAVTNCIVHGYEGGKGKIYINVNITGNTAEVIVKDNGIGIENIEKAMEPLYTTKPEQERSGMGFSFMEAFMDDAQARGEMRQFSSATMQAQANRPPPQPPRSASAARLRSARS